MNQRTRVEKLERAGVRAARAKLQSMTNAELEALAADIPEWAQSVIESLSNAELEHFADLPDSEQMTFLDVRRASWG